MRQRQNRDFYRRVQTSGNAAANALLPRVPSVADWAEPKGHPSLYGPLLGTKQSRAAVKKMLHAKALRAEQKEALAEAARFHESRSLAAPSHRFSVHRVSLQAQDFPFNI